MKTILVALLAAACGGLALRATDETVGGPQGGRLLEATPQPAEFFVTTDRKVEITFYDSALKPVTPEAQEVTVTAEPKGGRMKIALEKTSTGFVSKAPLPATDEPYRIVVQIRASPGARSQNFRIDLNLEECGECSRGEYACVCGH